MWNHSNGSTSGDLSQVIDKRLTVLEVIVLSVVFFLTLFGNLTVILSLLFFSNRKKSGRSSLFRLRLNTNLSRMSFYILNLSIADANVALMSILPQIIWRSSIVFRHSHFLCKLVTFCQVFSVYSSTFLLIVMAYDRYSCICWPIRSCSWSNRSASVSIVFSWLLAILVSSPQLFLFKVQPLDALHLQVITCCVRWPSKLIEGLYIFFHMSTQFVIPLLVLIFFYTNIFLTVSRNIRTKSDSIRMERGEPESSQMTPADKKRLSTPNGGELMRKNNSECSIYEQQQQNGHQSRKSLQMARDFFKRRKSEIPSSSLSSKRYQFFNRKASNMETGMPMMMMVRSSSPAATASSLHENQSSLILKSIKSMPIRQNVSRQELTKSKMKTLKLTLTVVFVYVLCTMPFYVCTLINFFTEKKVAHSPHDNYIQKILTYVTTITNLLYQLNSCANPFIYLLFNSYTCRSIEKKKRRQGRSNSNAYSGGGGTRGTLDTDDMTTGYSRLRLGQSTRSNSNPGIRTAPPAGSTHRAPSPCPSMNQSRL